tara:strand:+ start:77 stop:931 length:855 start_codon:yes stop_codon:yes gene_type:complete
LLEDKNMKIDNIYNVIMNDNKSKQFVDWDSTSGVLCGNGWGTCSNMAEIYMNIFSPTAENPILDKEIHSIYVNEFLNYTGPNWKNLWYNQIRSPYCLGGSAWGQGGTYNCGSMGPDWFALYDDSSEDAYCYGCIPCYGHLGDTYGSVSGHVYVPSSTNYDNKGGKPGILEIYPPWISDTNSYSQYINDTYVPYKNWKLTFHFAGGLEFTLSQCINFSDDQTTAIQNFITEVINDPFVWDKPPTPRKCGSCVKQSNKTPSYSCSNLDQVLCLKAKPDCTWKKLNS